jgi:hypothetical protein
MNARRYLLFIYVTMLTKMRISDAIQTAYMCVLVGISDIRVASNVSVCNIPSSSVKR